jgi:anhydro-N-acetylmuramic acid kinase
MKEGYFSAPPPKSCGREEFGAAFVTRFLAMCRKAGGRDEVRGDGDGPDGESRPGLAYRRFCWRIWDIWRGHTQMFTPQVVERRMRR